MPQTTPSGATSRRHLWADVAKGACIVLVVLHHVIGKHLLIGAPESWAPVVEAWMGVTFALKPVRMPLFFLVSGVFAARVVRRDWRAVLVRATSSYWVYVAWLLVGLVVLAWETELPANRTHGPVELAQDLVFASTGAWYLYALALYSLLVRATRRLPVGWVLSVALALALAVSWLPVEATNRQALLAHLVWFALGARAPEVATTIVDLGRRRRFAVAAALGYALLAGLARLVPAAGSVEQVVLAAIGVPAGLLVATGLARTALAAGTAWLGRHTLPVYVLHVPLLGAWHHLPGLDLALASLPRPLTPLYPLLLTALLVGAALGAHRLLLAARLPWLFAAPAPLLNLLRDPAERRPIDRHREGVPAEATPAPVVACQEAWRR